MSSYSGGMKRRLALVRSLIHEPSILILDEPTLGVDVQSRNEIWNRINELKKERIVILSTNYMDEANKLADRCAIIDQGKLIALDTTENLKINYAGGTILEASLELTTESLEKLNDVYSNLKVLKSDGRRSSITITENIEANQLLTKFSQTIQNFKDISVINLNVRVPTLDDVFLELTGTSLRD
ncbi:MAG: ATP-binding cassette domain-containing protein [Candidatus Heimdallarchaeota archaeon]|nr:ATP-binding cassette domain-containing protein [Candidatus Heimdallarchaeota archaeon]